MANRVFHSILVCDDKTEGMSLLIECLRDSDYQVTTVSNGLEGTLVYESLKPDLVIVNAIMPRLDGVSMIVYLKRSYPALKAILMTNSAESTRKLLFDQLDDPSAAYVMAKPVDIIEVVSTAHLMLLHDRPRVRRLVRGSQFEERLN
jgi:CheY-like chemotaxis protein